jgi:hypothetical protein
VAAQLELTFDVAAELVIGSPGEFTVWVDGAKVAEKIASVFPEPGAVVTAIRALRSI